MSLFVRARIAFDLWRMARRLRTRRDANGLTWNDRQLIAWLAELRSMECK